MAPMNRKGRRAAQAATDSASIPLSHPPQSSSPNVKTLYQIAAERQGTDPSLPSDPAKQGVPQTEFVHISPSGELSFSSDPSSASTESGNTSTKGDDDATIPPLPDTILFSFPLSVLNFTLSFLAAHQFAQEIPLRKLIQDAIFVAFPALTFLIHLAHGHIVPLPELTVWSRKKKSSMSSERNHTATVEGELSPLQKLFRPTPRNFFFLFVSFLLGARLIAISNDAGYYAVMKKAPPIGTLWVWCVLEMAPGFAALGLVVPLGWAVLYKGYQIY
ncbi:hypothetical protein VTO42DRAFT_6163 [Malbranchea cinnamomea]